jgi:integrase
VEVYAGTDPITGQRHNVIDTIQPGPPAKKDVQRR